MTDTLDQALEQGDWEKLKELILQEEMQNRAQIGLETHSELSPLQVAALYRPQLALSMLPKQETIDIATKVLLGLSVDEESVLEFAIYSEGFSPLGMAVYRGVTDSVQALLQRGDDPNRPQNRAGFYVWETEALSAGLARWTPLHIATLHGYLDNASQNIRLLCEKGADISAVNTYGAQAIHLAASHGWIESLEVLLALGAQVDAETESIDEEIHRLTGTPSKVPSPTSGITPLMVSIQEGFSAVVTCLLKRGADVNFTTADGYTPLHLSAHPWWSENTEIVETLLAHGADKTVRNDADDFPYDLAKRAGNLRTAELLKV